jgi:hypothetical protein
MLATVTGVTTDFCLDSILEVQPLQVLEEIIIPKLLDGTFKFNKLILVTPSTLEIQL